MKHLTLLLLVPVLLLAQGAFHDPGPAPANRKLINFYDGSDTNLPPLGWPSGTKIVKPYLFPVGTNISTGEITNEWRINTEATGGYASNWLESAYKTWRTEQKPLIYTPWESNLTWATTTHHVTNYEAKVVAAYDPFERAARTNNNIAVYVSGLDAVELRDWTRKILKRMLLIEKESQDLNRPRRVN